MSTQKQTLKQKIVIRKDENILVVKRDDLFPNDSSWQGLQRPKENSFVETIMTKKEFLSRAIMENDPSYKQIIPYLVFKNKNKYFLMQRKAKASESRLAGNYSLGIGGHIRQDDMKEADIASWARREFYEEVNYPGNFEVNFLGVLNDDSNDVGKVHVGFVYLLEGDSGAISVKEELESGVLLTLDECELFYDRMEQWTKIVFNFLRAS